MSPARPKLRVDPDLCDGCRGQRHDCVRACKVGALRVGPGYVYVDWERCDACLECVEMCDAGALTAPAARVAVRTPAATATSVAAPTASARPVPAAPARPTRPWTIADALVVLAVVLGSIAALDYVLALPIVRIMPPSGRVFARAAGLAVSYGVELLAVWALASRRQVKLRDEFALRLRPRSWVAAVTSAGLVLGMLLATRGLTTVYGMLTESLGFKPTVTWTTGLTDVFGKGRAGLALAIVLVAIVGPVVEEIVFRGVVQSALVTRAGTAFGIVTTALLFGLYHFDAWMFVPTALLGLALGWLAEKRAGLMPAIALHVLYNGVTVVAVFWVVAH